MSIILLLLVYCTYLVFFTLLIVNMYISNAGPHQPMAASFFNLQDQIKYVCMYVCRHNLSKYYFLLKYAHSHWSIAVFR